MSQDKSVKRRNTAEKDTRYKKMQENLTPDVVPKAKVPVISSFKRFQYSLYLTLFLQQLLPTVYKSVRIFYLGDLPNAHGVNIASQLTWVNLILEVFQEGLILPLYYLIGQSLNNHAELKNRIKIGVIFTFGCYCVLCAVIGFAAYPLALAMESSSIDATVEYVRYELASMPFEATNQFFAVLLTLLSLKKHLYVVLAVRLMFSVLLDTFFLSKMKYSLQLGVNAIAYTNIIISIVVFTYCCIVVFAWLKFKLSDIYNCNTYQLGWLKSWGKVGFFSGLDSFTRNLFYILCVIRMMNVIKKQGVYWRANEFIWNWLLLPFIPLSTLLKQDTCGQEGINHKIKMSAYMGFTFLIFLLWAITIPAWKSFFSAVINIDDVDQVFDLVLILSPFYLAYMLNTLLDCVLYGKGVTKYLALQSIITNCLINLPAFLLFLAHVYRPNLLNISLLFGASISMDSVITTILYYKFLKNENYMI